MAQFLIEFDKDENFETVEFRGTINIPDNLILPNATVIEDETSILVPSEFGVFSNALAQSLGNSVFIFDVDNQIVEINDENGSSTELTLDSFNPDLPSNVVVSLRDGPAQGGYIIQDIDLVLGEVTEVLEEGQYRIPTGLFGTSIGDDLLGTSGDDILAGFQGNDSIDGGDGTDIAVFNGPQESFTFEIGPDGATVADRRSEGEGTDQITNIEALGFSAGDFNIAGFEDLPDLPEEEFADLIELYIAYFNRAPDAIGLYFWGTAVASDIPLEDIAALFIDQDETRATYPDTLSNEDFATEVYANVLGRVADQAGFDFWVGALDSGGVSRDMFILEILKGTKADPQPGASQEFVDQQLADRQYLSDKTDVGAYFAVIKGMSDVDNASAAMALFDGSAGSITQAVSAIDTFHTDALDSDTGEFLMPLLGVIDDPFAVV